MKTHAETGPTAEAESIAATEAMVDAESIARTSNVTIRPAAEQDREAVLALLEAAALETAFVADQFTVVVEDAEVVGCGRLKPLAEGGFELASVVVRADRRGRGLGDRVTNAILKGVDAEVFGIALAPAFFARHGFTEVAALPASLAEKATHCAFAGATPVHRRGTSHVQAQYREIATSTAPVTGNGCCGATNVYSQEEMAIMPAGSFLSLGTGNPVKEARPQPGEIVLDIGSGAGGDVFLAANAVGPEGHAYGIDVTEEMVSRARGIAAENRVANATFLHADAPPIPLADASVDIAISNCVVNLAPDKAALMREVHRVMKPGGRIVFSDPVVKPRALMVLDADACGCTTGALSAEGWASLLEGTGFTDVKIDATAPAGYGNGIALIRAVKRA